MNEPLSSRDQTLLAAILDSAIDFAIIALDPDNKVTLWNPGAEKILGWTAEEIMGRGAELIFIAEDRAAGAVEAELTKAIANGRAEDERWHARKDGSRFWGSGLMMPLKDKLGFLKIMRDQTARRQAEHALRESEDRFRTLAQHIPQLVFRIAKFGRGDVGKPPMGCIHGLVGG